MRRRSFIALLGGAAAASSAFGEGSPVRPKRIAILEAGSETEETLFRIVALRAALETLSWENGRNLEIQLRWGEANLDRINLLARELVALSPDLIIAQSAPAVRAVLQHTRSIPVVFVHASDPVGAGFVSNLAKPGGNLTGFVNFEYSMVGKWLETLKEIAPNVSRVAVLLNPDNPSTPGQLSAFAQPAAGLKLELVPALVKNEEDIKRTIAAFAGTPNGGLVVMPIVLAGVHRKLILSLAATHRLPAMYPLHEDTRAGGLVSLGIDVNDLYRRAASYVDRILKGERPGDLPIQLPTKFELVINMTTAKSLGLDVPWILQQRADEVIE